MKAVIPLKDAREVLDRHRSEFESRQGVTGVGVAVRDGELRFVVSVQDLASSRQFSNLQEIEGLRLSVEVNHFAMAAHAESDAEF